VKQLDSIRNLGFSKFQPLSSDTILWATAAFASAGPADGSFEERALFLRGIELTTQIFRFCYKTHNLLNLTEVQTPSGPTPQRVRCLLASEF
jgi:hypothetical protein